jgi:hypothetical protein
MAFDTTLRANLFLNDWTILDFTKDAVQADVACGLHM